MWCDVVRIWNIIDECGEIMGNCRSFILRLMITNHSSSHIFVTCVTGVDVNSYVPSVTRNGFDTFV